MSTEGTQKPITLNQLQITTCEAWAADDRLWTTQETVAFNLKVFARAILRDAALADTD